MTDDGSPRVPPIESRAGLPEEHRDHWDHIESTRGHVSGPFPPLLNSPVVAGRIARVGTYIRYENVLRGDVRELAIIATAREFDCAYEWAAHEPVAREEGVPEDTIDVVAEEGPLEELSQTEALVVGFARELLRDHAVTDETFRVARDEFGVRGVTDLTATVGFYSLIACVLNGFDVRPAAGAPTLP